MRNSTCRRVQCMTTKKKSEWVAADSDQCHLWYKVRGSGAGIARGMRQDPHVGDCGGSKSDDKWLVAVDQAVFKRSHSSRKKADVAGGESCG